MASLWVAQDLETNQFFVYGTEANSEFRLGGPYITQQVAEDHAQRVIRMIQEIARSVINGPR